MAAGTIIAERGAPMQQANGRTVVAPTTANGNLAFSAARDEGLFDQQNLVSANMSPGTGLRFFQVGRAGRAPALTNSPVGSRLSSTQVQSVRGMRVYFIFTAGTFGGGAAGDIPTLMNDISLIQQGVFIFRMDDQPLLRLPFLKVAGPLVITSQIDAAASFATIQSGPGYYIEDPSLFSALPGSRNFDVSLIFPPLGASPIGARQYALKFELLGARANQAGRGM